MKRKTSRLTIFISRLFEKRRRQRVMNRIWKRIDDVSVTVSQTNEITTLKKLIFNPWFRCHLIFSLTIRRFQLIKLNNYIIYLTLVFYYWFIFIHSLSFLFDLARQETQITYIQCKRYENSELKPAVKMIFFSTEILLGGNQLIDSFFFYYFSLHFILEMVS